MKKANVIESLFGNKDFVGSVSVMRDNIRINVYYRNEWEKRVGTEIAKRTITELLKNSERPVENGKML